MRLSPRFMLQAGAAALLAFAAVIPAAGQRRTGPPGSPAREERERDQHERLQALHEMELRALTKPRERPEPRLALLQIAEDFKLLQVTTNGLMEAMPRADALDLKAVAKSASDIRERATRLRSNLVLPKPEKEDKRPKYEVPSDDEGLRRSLLVLDRLIYRFASNPVFSQPDVVDAELSLKARRDLEEIIELSGRVKKGCEGLEGGGKK